jgi:ribulose-5-phosphate 4-epimerase/fuculose-1-phosphate aldolase
MAGRAEYSSEETMSPTLSAVAERNAEMSSAEWEARVELAACYRIFDMLGWTEMIFNHITLRLPGPERHFLINPYGLWYREVTASNLVKIDIDGNVIGGSDWPVNRAGFVIHSAIHAARDDAHCIMHTHTTAGLAIACQQDGLRPDNFYSALLHGHVAYHDFEGVTTRDDEKPRLVRSLGSQNYLILRNHGLLTCGRSVPEAFLRMWTIERACQIQHAAQATGQPLIQLPEEVLARASTMPRQLEPGDPTDRRLFAALLRRVDAIDQSYKT